MDPEIDHSRSPLFISNHLGLSDGHIAYSLGEGPSILAKKLMQSLPFYGSIMSNAQSPFINRKDPDIRAKVLKLITDRAI